jgi:hypothetical protein
MQKIPFNSCQKTITKTAVFLFCLLFLIAGLTFSGCADDTGPVINLFLDDLVTRTDNAVNSSISRLNSIEQEMDAIRVQRNSLEQVVAPAREWLSLKQGEAEKYDWSRKVFLVIEDLPKLRNDRYEVARLGFSMELMGVYDLVIDIKDLSTGEIKPYEKVRAAIDEAEYTLVQEGNLITSSIQKASGAISKVMDRYNEIQATKINTSSYKLVGPLGLDDSNNLVQSQWTYNLELKKAEPAHQQAVQMQRVLECR